MWHPFRRNPTGSGLQQALEENNRLLRELLIANGIKLPAPRPSGPPQRKRTERDIVVMTRERILVNQLREELKGMDDPRSNNDRPTPSPEPASNASNAADTPSTPSPKS